MSDSYERFFQPIDEEKILAVAAPHLLSRLPTFLCILVWLTLPSFVLFPLIRLGVWGVVGLALWVVFGLWLLARTLLRWKRDLFIVTTERVVAVEPRLFRLQAVEELSLVTITSVETKRIGIFDRLWRTGMVIVRADARTILKEHLSHANEIAALIDEARRSSVNGMKS